MNTVSMHRKYAICTQYLDSMLEHSVELLEGESKLDAYRRGFKELDQIAAELRKEANPYLYEESTNTLQAAKPIGAIYVESTPADGDEALTLIKNAPSIEVLSTFKLIAGSGNKELYDAYNQRLKALIK